MIRKIIQWIVSYPKVYDVVQNMMGLPEAFRRLTPHLSSLNDESVLDVGAGTGNYFRLIPDSAFYIALDLDPDKLHALKSKIPNQTTLLCDASKICLRDQSVDSAICIALSHHLGNDQFEQLLLELNRVVRNKFIFLDAVRCEESLISKILWRFDRGEHPRKVEFLRDSIEQFFNIDELDVYSVYHQYLFVVASRKKLHDIT